MKIFILLETEQNFLKLCSKMKKVRITTIKFENEK